MNRKRQIVKFIESIPRRLICVVALILVCYLMWIEKDITAAPMIIPVFLYGIFSNTFEDEIRERFVKRNEEP